MTLGKARLILERRLKDVLLSLVELFFVNTPGVITKEEGDSLLN